MFALIITNYNDNHLLLKTINILNIIILCLAFNYFDREKSLSNSNLNCIHIWDKYSECLFI